MRLTALVGRRLTIPLSLLVALASCTMPGEPEFEFGDMDLCPDISGLRVDSSEVHLRIGDEVQLTASVLDAQGQPGVFCPSATWSSSDPGGLRVGADGRATMLAAGSYWAFARFDELRDSLRVVASTAPIASLTIGAVPTDFLVGQNARLDLTARDASGTLLPIRRASWRSSSMSTIAITESGAILARAPGTTTISLTVEDRTEAIAVATSRDAPAIRFTAIDAGALHACALLAGGGVEAGTPYCWGGTLGTAPGARSRPARVETALKFEGIAVGGNHSCAWTAAGEAWCWGENFTGELGDGTRTAAVRPVKASTNVPLRGLAASAGATCGLASDGIAHCWGAWAGATSARPAPMATPARFTQLAAGDRAICGLATDGGVFCWGELAYQNFRQPTNVSGTLRFRAIDMGALTLCGVDVDGSVHCWGVNTGGFWSGEVTRRVPVRLAPAETFVSVAVGGSFICATDAEARLWCLGTRGPGGEELGAGLRPLTRAPQHEFARVVGGGLVGCAIDVVGGAWCWGNALEGGTGTGNDFSAWSPLQLRVDAAGGA